MTTTIDALVHDVLGSVPTSVGAPIVIRWINNRYQELVSTIRFRNQRQVGALVLPAIVSTGTVSATRGSTTITPDVTAAAAWVTSPGVSTTHEYWFIRISTNWYRVSQIAAFGATLTLASAFTEDDVTSGTYKLVKRYHPLASTARWFSSFNYERLRYELSVDSLLELDMYAPSRIIAGAPPVKVAQVGTDSNGAVMIEVYPPPENSETLSYFYWTLPTEFAFGDNLPSVIDPYVLKEGVMIDLYRYEKVAAIKAGNIEQAAVYANEEAKQRKVWEDRQKDAIRTSRATEDTTLILSMFRGAGPRQIDQKTAHDYVYDNWSR